MKETRPIAKELIRSFLFHKDFVDVPIVPAIGFPDQIQALQEEKFHENLRKLSLFESPVQKPLMTMEEETKCVLCKSY